MPPTNEPRALEEKIILAGIITALTGLHIGGNDVGLGIGGADKLVVRDPRTKRPYIPGSSLKGKMRSLLEKVECAKNRCRGFVVDTEKLKLDPCGCGVCEVCVVFGVPAETTRTMESDKPYAAASHALFRDAFMTELSAVQIEKWPNLDFPYTEVKTEVAIDRLTSKANPRQFERVPAGAEFEFEITLNVYSGDETERHLALLKRGLALVPMTRSADSSRGYGQVQIRLQRLVRVKAEDYRNDQVSCARAKNELSGDEVFGGRLAGEAAA